MKALLISLYVLAAIITVPFAARYIYTEGDSLLGDRAFCVGWALIVSYVWPVLLFIWGFIGLSKALVTLVFKGRRP